MQKIESSDVYDNGLLNSVRNAIILLVLGLAVLEFGGRLRTTASWIFVLTTLFLFVALYNYATRPYSKTYLGWTPYLVLGLIGLSTWFLYQSSFSA